MIISTAVILKRVVNLLDDLEKRKRLRQKKARDEKRREKRIEIEENKKQGKCKYGLWNTIASKSFSVLVHDSTAIYLYLCPLRS